MRLKVGTLLLGLICVVPVLAGPQEKTAPLRIDYMGFSETVRVAEAALDFSYLQQTPMGRGARLNLTQEQVRLYENWIERCGVFALKKPDVKVGDPNHPGAQEYSHLLVDLGEQKLELSWTGVSVWNNPDDKEKLDKAIDELNKLCFRLLREAGLIDTRP